MQARRNGNWAPTSARVSARKERGICQQAGDHFVRIIERILYHQPAVDQERIKKYQRLVPTYRPFAGLTRVAVKQGARKGSLDQMAEAGESGGTVPLGRRA